MALDPSSNPTMSGRITPADVNYPYGSSQDETAPAAGDGTPYFKARADDIFGLQQALLADAGIVPSGNADTAVASQYLEAMNKLLNRGAFKNRFVNGDFSIAQRGDNFTPSGIDYTIDQWVYAVNPDGGTLGANTVDRIAFPVGQIDVPGNPTHYADFSGTITTGGTDSIVALRNRIEGVGNYSGEKVTLSFWIKGSISGTARHVMRQVFGSGGSPSATVNCYAAEDIAVTTAWQKVTKTFDMPSVSGKTVGTNGNDVIDFDIHTQMGTLRATNLGTSGQLDYTGVLSIADVQIERGRYAGDFERLFVADQLLRCQRYYQLYQIGGNRPMVGRGGLAGLIASQVTQISPAMRGQPTGSLLNSLTTNFAAITAGAAAASSVTPTVNTVLSKSWSLNWAGTGATNSAGYFCEWGGNAETVILSSEI